MTETKFNMETENESPPILLKFETVAIAISIYTKYLTITYFTLKSSIYTKKMKR